jgi:RimJ/RimL family protein N-acetyltransferase
MLTHAYPKEATLRDGRRVVIRPLTGGDFDKLHGFFQALPEEDRLFLRNDVTDPEVIGRWVENLDFGHVIPLVAVEGDKIVGDGTLHLPMHGWSRHVGHIRLVTARTHRQTGLGTLIARELVALAEERNLEKMEAHVVDDDIGSVTMFERLGFKKAATLENMIKDRSGNHRNMAIMVSDVSDLGRVMEDWIQDSMQAAFRVPDDGAA